MTQKNDINFRNLLDEVSDGIYICDLYGKFIYVNHALTWMLGFEDPEDIIGKSFSDFLPSDKANILISQFQKLEFTKKDSDLFTSEVIRRDSLKMYIEINPSIFVKDGDLVGNQGVVRNITKRKQEEQRMQYLSTHDTLTGLYNRTFFEAEMKRLERGRQFPISIVVVNVRGMKRDSDSEKNGMERKQLKRVAHVIFNAFRGDDIVSCIREDEFAVLLPSVDENTLDEIVKRVEDNLSAYNYHEHESHLEFYIGAGTTKEGADLNSVLKQAESIVFLSKKKNKII